MKFSEFRDSLLWRKVCFVLILILPKEAKFPKMEKFAGTIILYMYRLASFLAPRGWLNICTEPLPSAAFFMGRNFLFPRTLRLRCSQLETLLQVP